MLHCDSPIAELSDPERLVYPGTCERCQVADLAELPAHLRRSWPTDGVTKLQTCIHAGRAIRGKTEVCGTCGGGEKELQVFACAKIGETHAGKCGSCQLYEAKLEHNRE